MPAKPLLSSLLAREWFRIPVRRPERSLTLLRIAVAVLLLVHPLHAFLHAEDRAALAQVLTAHHLPGALAWGVLLLQTACSLALLTSRGTLAAGVGHLLVLGTGTLMLEAPYWFVVGGAVVPGHRGMEYSLLLMAALAAVLWGRRAPARGLDLIRVAAAAILVIHPLHGFYDYRNLGPFGHSFDDVTFHHGLALVYLMLATQTVCCLALLARRFVVPACAGHLFILGMGVWLAHWPDWFVVGPGSGGMEYSVLLMASFTALLLAHWPARAVAPDFIEAPLAETP
ncbi:MAG TPA: hypothetical protein VJ600_10270 [Holophagaceae bacterium]|nr:hypothetical protein [Holophagaceae bacterium]